MKKLKNILWGALGMLILLFVIGIFLPDEETVTDPGVTSADEFYGGEGSSDNVPVPSTDGRADGYAGRITFYKMDIDQAGEVSDAYGIQSIPTLFFCSDGQIESITGVPDKDELDKKIAGMQ